MADPLAHRRLPSNLHYQQGAFRSDRKNAAAYLLYLSFSDRVLEPDIAVTYPDTVKVVAELAEVIWKNIPKDPLQICGRVSAKNRELMQDSLESLSERADVKARFVIYKSDSEGMDKSLSAKLETWLMDEIASFDKPHGYDFQFSLNGIVESEDRFPQYGQRDLTRKEMKFLQELGKSFWFPLAQTKL